MKKLVLLVAILLMAFVALSAEVLVNISSDSHYDFMSHPGNTENMLYFQIENTGINSVTFQSTGISCINHNLTAPQAEIEFTLSRSGNSFGPVFNVFDITFNQINDIINPGESILYILQGYISPTSPVGGSYQFGFSGPGNFSFIEDNTNLSLVPVLNGDYGSTWTIGSNPVNPNQPMHYIDIWPRRNPIQVEDLTQYYMQDNLYVYRGQRIPYYSSMQPIYTNSLFNTVVGFNQTLSLSSNQNPYGWELDGYPYCTDGYLGNIGMYNLYNFDNNTFTFTWVKNTLEGINSCGLMGGSFINQMMPGSTGSFWNCLEINNFNVDFGMRTEYAYHNINFISVDRIRGDVDGDNIFELEEDTQTALAMWPSNLPWELQYEPEGFMNFAASHVVWRFNSLFNLWAMLANILGLHLGELFDGNAYGIVPLTYTNNGGTISLQTDGNAVGIQWKNPDGSFGSETIMFTEGNRALKWTDSVQPTEIVVNNRNEELFQLPLGAQLIDVQAAQIEYSPTSTDDPTTPVINTPTLGNAYPNPFNPETSISYNLPKSGAVTIDIFNSRGQLIRTLVNETKSAGNHTTIWNGIDNNNQPVSSGIYFYKMFAGKFSATKKMILMK